METPELNLDRHFWESSANNALLNVNVPGSAALQDELEHAAAAAGLRSHVIFATSGSTGEPKFVCLAKDALLHSAAAVNAHLNATTQDIWFCALPGFHVGGAGIFARGHLLGNKVLQISGKWNPKQFIAQLDSTAATLTSLVPTQIFDLVNGVISCPARLRAVVVGGAALNPDLREAARTLGWPLLESFGMTESASQIATRSLTQIDSQSTALNVLPIWETRQTVDSRLAIRGAALFSGYLTAESGTQVFTFSKPFSSDGWFETTDRIEVDRNSLGQTITPLGRADEVVKILGENVNVDRVQHAIDPFRATIVIVALPDPRSGSRLVAVIEKKSPRVDASVDSVIHQYNAHAPPLERVLYLCGILAFPKNELGKISKWQLLNILMHENDFKRLKEGEQCC